uniref:Uncharacterized protein n=1 Tax=Daucus carota subsp. sativus TaxID=79200 RepID=A0A166IGA3_DAUCS
MTFDNVTIKTTKKIMYNSAILSHLFHKSAKKAQFSNNSVKTLVGSLNMIH